MLVHKATMGILDRIWTGQHTRGPDGILNPVERPARPSDVDDPEEWWEIPSSGTLAKKIRRYYPWITPEIGQDGKLVDVQIQRDTPKQAVIREELRKEAAKRGYKQPKRLRPRGIMPFLSDIQKGCDPNVRQEDRYRPVSG